MPVLLPAPEQTLASALSLATGGVAEEAVHTSRRSEDVRHGEEFADLVAAAGAADVEHEATRHQKKQRSFHLKDVDVLEDLGSGSFGCVFRCRVQDTEYDVKVKHRVCSQGTADNEVAILKHLAQDKPNRFVVQLLAGAAPLAPPAREVMAAAGACAWERMRRELAQLARQERTRLPFRSHFLPMEWSLNNSFQIAT